MARRRKSSGAEDFVDLVALLPWWAGVLVALVSYVLLHRYATAPQPSAAGLQPGQIGAFAVSTMWHSLATVGQYLVPALALLGAGLSVIRRRQRKALFGQAAQAGGASAIDGMSWQQFELLVGEAFRQQGYRVSETGGGGADGGVDLVLAKGGETFLVQCKQWRAYRVGVGTVRELYGVMAARGAAGGFVVTSGRFTDEAKAFASGRNVQLLDGERLKSLIDRTTSGRAPAAPPGKGEAVQTSPACPTCGSAMVRRTAKQGPYAGSDFWGCSTYPRCKAKRALP